MPGREGFNPEEAKAEQSGERIEKTDSGWRKLDAEGRTVAEHQEIRDPEGRLKESQEIIVEHGEPEEKGAVAPSVERGHLTEYDAEGKVRAEKDLVREHPETRHELSLSGTAPDGTTFRVKVEARLATLGSTVAGAKTNEPWAHFEVTGQDAAEAFAGFTPDEGKSYRQLNGDFGSADIEVNGRQIRIEKIGRISLDFDADGTPTKATIHKIEWREVV